MRRTEFNTTRIELKDMPMAAAQGGTQPSAARGIAIRLYAAAQTQILAHDPPRPARQKERTGKRPQRIADEHEIRAGQSEGGAAAHGDGQPRAPQNRRIVDAISHHGDEFAPLAERLDAFELAGRRLSRRERGNAAMLGKTRDGGKGVSAENFRAQALREKFPHGARALRPRRVLQFERCQLDTLARKDDHCIIVRASSGRPKGPWRTRGCRSDGASPGPFP